MLNPQYFRDLFGSRHVFSIMAVVRYEENALKSESNAYKWRKMKHLSSRSICSAVRLMELLSTQSTASKRSTTSSSIARAA